ncbi:MAG: hypothetical protein GYB66_06610 [Chloroflexi bacterium]|nr:hypothetical protein [Chloroflexota bacterium]
MNLDEYEWSRNPRGMHSVINYLNMDIMRQDQMGWAKIVALADGEKSRAQDAMNLGITPIVRIYRERPGNAPVDAEALRYFETYRKEGVRWFEYYNEPNLEVEWPVGADFDPKKDHVLFPFMDNWLNWAEFIVSIDGYPGFPALADANNGEREDTITWITRMLDYLHAVHFDRFRAVLDGGCYIATHPYVFNHFYQEQVGGGPRSARPPEYQNLTEGGWHFEYPYDPICQDDDPGRTVWGGTQLAPHGDTVSLLGSGLAIMERLQTLFDVGAIPVVGTEGGIPVPAGPRDRPQADNRYPPYTWESHAKATIAMFEWITTTAPPWFFGVALWKFDLYYQGQHGPMQVADFFDRHPALYKQVPPIPALMPPNPPEVVPEEVPGPGPVHGEADFHFVFLTPGLETDWFFEIAAPYWDAFRPTLMPDLEYIDLLPGDKSLVVTAITLPGMVDWLNASILHRWPNVWLDIVVVDSEDTLAQQLNSRVAVGRRFG